VPAALKMVRWLLWLPGGDRTKGLAEILQAREHGELLGGEIEFQLQLLYLWYEGRTGDALAILRMLDSRYPFNPLFLQRTAESYDTYLHDHRASANAWRVLLARAQSGAVYDASTAETRAHLGLARQLAALNETETAIKELQIVIARQPRTPVDAISRAQSELRALTTRRSSKDIDRRAIFF